MNGAVSLENVLLDVRELGKGMDLIKRECSRHDHPVLKTFLHSSDALLDKLQKDAKASEVLPPHHRTDIISLRRKRT